jgi:hypothetical protein
VSRLAVDTATDTLRAYEEVAMRTYPVLLAGLVVFTTGRGVRAEADCRLYATDTKVACATELADQGKARGQFKLYTAAAKAHPERAAAAATWRATLEAADKDVERCTQRVELSAERRRAAAIAGDRALLEKVPSECRLPEEKQADQKYQAAREADRIRAEAEAAAVAARVEERKKDPKWMVPLVSALLCVGDTTRAAARHELDQQKQKAKKAKPPADPQKVQEMETVALKLDDWISRTKKELVTWKAKPAACTEKRVKTLTKCLEVPKIAGAAPFAPKPGPAATCADEFTSGAREILAANSGLAGLE